MEILLLVFFIVSEADFHDTNIEFLIDYILRCSGSLVTLSEICHRGSL